MYVEGGGNLFTEDWGLREVVEKAWPKFLVSGSYLREQEVDIAPARGRTSHPLMRGIFVDPPDKPEPEPEEEGKKEGDGEEDEDDQRTKDGKKTIDADDEEEIIRRIKTLNHKWKIDDESPYMRIRNKREVTKLLESEKVGKLADGNDAVAVTFFVGRGRGGQGGVERRRDGRILHVLSHFGKQSSIESEFALQNLLLNFLLEANHRWYQNKKAKKAGS